MRIAISGTHCSGKSTLIDLFLVKHPHYAHEPEAYEVLQDLHGESFSSEPSAEEFVLQLNYQISRLSVYHKGDKVILERSPVDYLAYLEALVELDRDGADRKLFEQAISPVRDALKNLDAVALLPLTGGVSAEEDPKLRRRVDELLQSYLLDDALDLLTSDGPLIVECYGSPEARLAMIEESLRLCGYR